MLPSWGWSQEIFIVETGPMFRRWTSRRSALEVVPANAHTAAMNLLERITVESGKCGGRPCIRGMRIRVTDILGMLADGTTHEEILKDFPYLEPDDIKAALAYAARQADHAILHAA